jgi:hypothetical protein
MGADASGSEQKRAKKRSEKAKKIATARPKNSKIQ